MKVHQPLRDCSELAALLKAVQDEGSGDYARLVANHIRSCAECAQAETHLARMIGVYAAAEAPPLSEDLERRLLDVMTRERCDGNG